MQNIRVVAYGSLLNRPSLERSLGRKAVLTPVVIQGVQRVFDAPFDGFAFGNLKKDPKSSIEAAWFELAESELVKFAEREAGSDLKEVGSRLWAFVWPEEKCRSLPVVQSYLDVCAVGADRLGLDFWRGTKVPVKVIDDRLNPVYA